MNTPCTFPHVKNIALLVLLLLQGPATWSQIADSTDLYDETQLLLKQTSQGSVFTGVNFGLGLGVRNENVILDNSTVLVDFHIYPKAGVFVADQWLVGGGFDYFTSVATFDAGDEYRLSLRALSAFTRFYLTSGLFAELNYGWGNGNETYTNNNQTASDGLTGSKLTGGIGIGNFWFDQFNFEILLQYGVANGSYKNLPGDFSFNGLKISAGIGFCPNPKR